MFIDGIDFSRVQDANRLETFVAFVVTTDDGILVRDEQALNTFCIFVAEDVSILANSSKELQLVKVLVMSTHDEKLYCGIFLSVLHDANILFAVVTAEVLIFGPSCREVQALNMDNAILNAAVL